MAVLVINNIEISYIESGNMVKERTLKAIEIKNDHLPHTEKYGLIASDNSVESFFETPVGRIRLYDFKKIGEEYRLQNFVETIYLNGFKIFDINDYKIEIIPEVDLIYLMDKRKISLPSITIIDDILDIDLDLD